MTEYLINYKKLLELEDINEKEIQENEQIIRENYQKWSNTKDKEETLDTEIKTLNKKYDDIMDKKEKELLSAVLIISILLSIIGIILTGIFVNPIWLLAGIPISIPANGSIYLTAFIINKTTSIFDKQFHKDKNISNLLEQIDIKEKELTDIKKLCEGYSQQLIKYREISKNLNKRRLWIIDSIDELMRNYATPIFEEKLKNIDEEAPEISKPKTKKKVKTNE